MQPLLKSDLRRYNIELFYPKNPNRTCLPVVIRGTKNRLRKGICLKSSTKNKRTKLTTAPWRSHCILSELNSRLEEPIVKISNEILKEKFFTYLKYSLLVFDWRGDAP